MAENYPPPPAAPSTALIVNLIGQIAFGLVAIPALSELVGALSVVTMPALLDSDALIFVIRGAEKQALFEAALAGKHDLPVARLLGAAHQPVTCFT